MVKEGTRNARSSLGRISIIGMLLLFAGAAVAWFSPIRGWLMGHEDAEIAELGKPVEIPALQPNPQQAALKLEDEAKDQAVEAALVSRVETLLAQLEDDAPSVRRQADVALRNLPLPAYPRVQAFYEQNKDKLLPETRARLEKSIQTWRILAALDKQRRENWLWWRGQVLKAFEDGIDDAKPWKADAREAITLMTRRLRDPADDSRIAAAFERASAAGPDNAIYLYYDATFYQRSPSADPDEYLRRLKLAAERLERSDLPAYIECYLHTRLARVDKRHLLALTNEFMVKQAFSQIRKEDQVPSWILYDLAIEAYRDGISHDYLMEDFKTFHEPFARLVPPDSPQLLLFHGAAHQHRAFEDPPLLQRNDPRYSDPQGRARQHLQTAEQSLKRAWELDSSHPAAAIELMALYERQLKTAEADEWFQRAMQADPDSREACRTRMALLPTDQALEFGRELLAQQNWRARIPFLMIEKHLELANWSQDQQGYYAKPEVWRDIRQVYEGFLSFDPGDVLARSEYANLAMKSSRWVDADRQFKLLGDNPVVKVFGSMETYNYMRKRAARKLAESAS